MVRFTRFALLGFAFVMFIGLALVLMDLQGKQVTHRNKQRTKDVQYVLDRIEAYAKENNSVPSFPAVLQQIGSAEHGCTLSTNSCKVTNDSCININNVMNDRDLSLPSDVSSGTYYKTGYAAEFNPQTQTITIVSCGAEKGESIQASRGLHELLVPRELKNVKK